ncbi:MAG: C39 family peptidase [Chloroflexota bacterium]|nr:C39 family peptidase [Chloroflexota bacterium]
MKESFDLDAMASRLSTPLHEYHQHQGTTNNCGPTSLAIAANAIRGQTQLQGPIVAQELSTPKFRVRPIPHLVIRRIPNWATFPWGIVDYLHQQGLTAHWAVGGTEERLQHNLATEQITIVLIGELWSWRRWHYTGWAHFKVLYGFTTGRGYLFVDPARGDKHGLSWQTTAEFLQQWRNLFRIYVEVN